MTRRTALGDFRAYCWFHVRLGAVACIGGFLFGYDSGLMGAIITFASFQDDFRYGKGDATRTNSLVVGIQQAGAFVGCWAISPVAARWGRRSAIEICSTVFTLGAILQTINTHSLPAFYVGRVISGLGLGGSSVIISMFSSENAPKEIRGRLGSFYQLMYTFGIFTAYWVDYAVANRMGSVTRQWQVPIGLQIIPAVLLGVGMLTVTESVRWLAQKGRHEEAWESLKWIRADDSAETRAELEEIQASIAEEQAARSGFQYSELLERHNFKLLAIGVTVFLCQQSVGATALAYYGPQFFKLLVGAGPSNLLLTAIFGAVKIVACGTFVLFFAERIGRKSALIGGASFMAVCMIIITIVTKVRPPPGGGVITSSGIATVALIYLNIMAYNFSWGPLPWPIVSEIFPARIKEIGVATGVGSQWLWNFMYSFSVSYMMAAMNEYIFLFFGVADILIVLFTIFVLKETRGLSLEEVQTVYSSDKTRTKPFLAGSEVEGRSSIDKRGEPV
ncbi:general substrate transporter [Mycena maculata]|uniref:General substrate transporter n=1 Tax=Mycena maculata TaxID=230809 RepID=A0AAD7K7Z2_9AGAR|nr:general substrate transporter [Mycena maculata]